MRLTPYIEAVDGSETAFARRARLPQSTVSRVCHGGGCNARTALLIIRATLERPAPGGLVVTLEDLVEDEETAA